MATARKPVKKVNKQTKVELDLVEVGKRLTAVRLKKGWSQTVVANKADINRSFLSTIETGRQNIGLVIFFDLCWALETNMSTILEGL